METKKNRQHQETKSHRRGERRRDRPSRQSPPRPGQSASRGDDDDDDDDMSLEVSRAGYKAAHMLALKQRVSELRERVQALERSAHEEKARHHKLVLRELVKEARARIVEVNGLAPPTSKQSWKYCLHSLSPVQLQRANVSLKLWPELVEILSPSAAKLNDWVHGYTTEQAALVIQGMEEAVQGAWGELFKVTHRGEGFEEYAAGEQMPPFMADELPE